MTIFGTLEPNILNAKCSYKLEKKVGNNYIETHSCQSQTLLQYIKDYFLQNLKININEIIETNIKLFGNSGVNNILNLPVNLDIDPSVIDVDTLSLLNNFNNFNNLNNLNFDLSNIVNNIVNLLTSLKIYSFDLVSYFNIYHSKNNS